MNNTNIKRRIAALTIAGAMLSSFTACDRLKSLELKDGTYELRGKIDFNDLAIYHVIEINNNYLEHTSLYLVRPYHDYDVCHWNMIGTNMEIASSSKEYTNFESGLGEVVRTIPINELLPLYAEVKKTYSGKEIEEIFENIKKDYPTYDFNGKSLIKII